MKVLYFLKGNPLSTRSMPKSIYSACCMAMVLLLVLTAKISAQTTITLAQAIHNGFSNKQNISAQKLDLTIRQLQTKALYRKYYPQLSADYQYVYNPILPTSILPIGVFNPSYPIEATKSVQFGTTWTQSAGLTATQHLFDLSIRNQIAEAKLQERISALSQEQTEYELAYAIAQTYMDIYLGEAKIRSLTTDTSRTYLNYTLLKSKFDEKRLLKSDLNKAKVNHNKAVQLLNDGIAQWVQDKVYLLFLMGTQALERWDFVIDPNFSLDYVVSNKDTFLYVAQLPALKQLSLQAELTDLLAKSERAKHVPKIGLKGYLGANQFANTFDPTATNTWFGLSYVGLVVSVPLLFGENSNNKIQQLKLQSNQYQLQREALVLEHSNEALAAKIKVDNAKMQLYTQAENIMLLTEAIVIVQARFKEGQASASDLNLEEVGIQMLKNEYETNKKQLWVYWLAYLKATGQLSILWK